MISWILTTIFVLSAMYCGALTASMIWKNNEKILAVGTCVLWMNLILDIIIYQVEGRIPTFLSGLL